MGYFNYFIKCFISNITRMLCKPKNLLIISVVCIILLLFTSSCFASDVTIVNPSETITYNNIIDLEGFQYDDQFGHLYTMQNSLQQRLIANLYANKANPGFNDLVTAIFNECKNLGLDNKTLYVTYGTSNTEFVIYYTYTHLLSDDVEQSFHLDSDDYYYTNVPVCWGNFTRVGYILADNNVTSAVVSFHGTHTMAPFACLNVFNPSFIDLFRYYGLITDENSSELNALNRIADQTNNSLNTINSQIQQQNQLQQSQNNFLQNTDVDVGASDLPGDSTTDITSSGFNNIFDLLYNTFTSSAAADLVLPLPFVNKSITINYANVFGAFNGGIIFTLANAFWFYVVSVYIVKDIYHKIYAIKSGNIENVENNNIKEDLL